MIYRVSGFTCSDELYHHGILGQKWGVRRYQNEDGTLTAAGKVRYAAKVTGETIGNAAKVVGKHQVDKFKGKHTWMMSDDELAARTDRLRRENTLREEIRKNKQSTSRAKRVVADCLEGGVKTISSKAFNRLAEKIFDKKDPAVRELTDVLTDPNATAKEIREAKEKFEIQNKYNAERVYNDYLRTYSETYGYDPNTKTRRIATKDEMERMANELDMLREIAGLNKGGKGKNNKKNANGGGNP